MNNYISIFTINSVAILLFLLAFFTNNISNNNIFFGVRFPREYLEEKELLNLEKKYKKIVILMFLFLIIIINIIIVRFFNKDENVLGFITGAIIIFMIIASELILLLFYFKTKRIKKDKGWTYKNKNIVITDTSFRKPKKDDKYKTISSYWFLMLFIFPIITTIITFALYKNLPETMGIDTMTYGAFYPHTSRGKFIIFQFPLVQFFTCIIMYIVNLIINNSKTDLNSGNIDEIIIKKKKLRRLISIMLMVIALEIMIMFSVIQYSLLFTYKISMIYSIFIFIIFITILVFIIKIIKEGKKKTSFNSSKDELYKDDDKKWILGSIYYNKNDPAWIVEKRVGVGWTVNFARLKSWVAIILLILFIGMGIIFS